MGSDPMIRTIPGWLGGALLAAALGCNGASSPLAQAPASGEKVPQFPQTAPPALGEMPPNASRVTATVLRRTVWPPGSLADVRPAVRPNRAFYSLTIETQSAAPDSPDLPSLARPGMTLEVFSSESLSAHLVGKKITATVQLTGDTQGTRWQISNLQVLP